MLRQLGGRKCEQRGRDERIPEEGGREQRGKKRVSLATALSLLRKGCRHPAVGVGLPQGGRGQERWACTQDGIDGQS